ncbi:peptidyl-prolyl cis-trans isomerase [Bifidobacterium italicum]|uniref:Peptidyl-prolyl cis-trans isomerase n=1 Tax=Bifidobacterium italicum TaxID=1960968 RepID=A0A2A2EJN4_9BIFI|nr:DUF4190 domain-containing protein [Bifidobacterium italicum]PAU69243.1 peptidyl-prolyl cis-trans isomerase [Bifidobacterium italicum]
MTPPTPTRGAPAYASAAPARPAERWSVFAVVGFVCAWLLPPAGLACSIVALARIADDRTLRGRGLAIAGIVVSAVVMLAAIAVIACFVWFGLMFIPYGMQLRAG